MPGVSKAAPEAARDRGMLPEEDVPWLEEVQQHEVPADAPTPEPILNGAGATLRAWKRKRAQIRERWSDYLGVIAADSGSPELNVLEEDRPTGVVRQLVEFQSEPGETVRGYLIKPQHIDAPRPGVLALHPTVPATIRQSAGLRDRERDYSFGLRLAQMGFVTFSPENFLWRDPFDQLLSNFHTQYPDSSMNWSAKKDIFAGVVENMQRQHPEAKGMAKMLFDAQRGLDVLQSLDEVNPRRLGTIGHSLGSMQALYLTAFDERVQAAVSNEPGISTDFQNWYDPWYLGEEIREFDHDQHELLALIAPRPFLLMGGGGVDGATSWPYVQEALEVYGLYGEPRRLGFLNHEAGHNVPPVAEFRAYQWLLTYL